MVDDSTELSHASGEMQETTHPPFTKEVRKSTGGNLYEFYTLPLLGGQNVKVVFRSPEEMIDPDVITEDDIIFTGEDARFLPEDKYSEWKHTVLGTERKDPKEKKDTLFVSSRSIKGILELAIKLDPQNTHIQDLYQSAISFSYSDDLLSLIDTVIAARTTSSDGKKKLDDISNDAEALVLSDLLGNGDARQLVEGLELHYAHNYSAQMLASFEKRKTELSDFDSRIETERETLGEQQRIDIDDLIAVHCTKYLPTYDLSSGKYKIKTLFDATEGEKPRTSIHFTLNEPVASHMYGDWSEMGVVVLVPFKDLVEVNGKPESMIVEDTYWNLNPGQDIVLPEGTTILIPENSEGVQQARGGVKIEAYAPGDQTHLDEIKKELAGERTPQRALQLLDEEGEELKKIANQRNDAINQRITGLGYKTIDDMIQKNRLYFQPTDRQREAISPDHQIEVVARSMGADIMRHAGSWGKLAEDIGWDYLNEPAHIDTPKESFSSIRSKYRNRFLKYWNDMPTQQRRTMWLIGLL